MYRSSARLVLAFCAIFVGTVQTDLIAQSYSIRALGVPGANYVAGESVSGNGLVAGGFFDSSDAAGGFWDSGSTLFLSPLVPGGQAYANSINNAGLAVGYSFNAANQRRAVAWNNGGSPVELGTLGGTQSSAFGVNNAGQVVGSSRNSANFNRPFLWTESHGMSELPMHLGGATASARAINDAGQIAGFARNSVGDNRAVLFDLTTSSTLDLGTLGGPESFANGLSSNGFVAGLSDAPNDEFRPFFWSVMTGMLDIFANGNLGSPFGAAYDVNRDGFVVGYGEINDNFDSHAFVWSQATGLLDLNTFIDPSSGWILAGASGINDRGQITGWGLYQGSPTGFLLTPVPEPSSAVFLAMGLGLLALGRRKK